MGASMAEPIISVSGLRGIVGETLTPEVAIRYTRAFVAFLPPGPILIARDSRSSGVWLAEAIHAGLNAAGRDTLDAGILATPTTGVLLRECRAAGGIQITASHNPSQYNGIKLFSTEGRVIPAALGRQVLEQYRASLNDIEWDVYLGKSPHPDPLRAPIEDWSGEGTLASGPRRSGSWRECENVHSAHLHAVLNIVKSERIRARAFKVLLDSNGGAGGPLGRKLLEELGCQVTILGEEPDGQFAHTPEPTAENLTGVCAAMTAGNKTGTGPVVSSNVEDQPSHKVPVPILSSSVDVGFCQDPDADRLAVIDESGQYIGEEYTVAMCVDHILRQRKGPIVTNCSSSRMSEDLAGRHGVPFFRSAVGEANVVDAMLAHRAIFGGEGNGGPIDPRVGLVRDSFVGMALLLDAMAARGLKISHLAGELPRYEIMKTKIALPQEEIPAALDALQRRFSDAKADRLDGLRLDWRDKWLLVRGSNTEPIVRAIAEAPTVEEAGLLCETAAKVIARV
jgi:phosphomannomutase